MDDGSTEPLIKRPRRSSSASYKNRTHSPQLGRSLLVVILMLVFAVGLVFLQATRSVAAIEHHVQPAIPGLAPHVYMNLAMYAPYFPSGRYEAPPKGCHISQVNIIQRHGARYPTGSVGKTISNAVSKLKDIPIYADRRLDFIHNYTYSLGTETLLPFGAQQSLLSGAEAYHRYSSLVNHENVPFVRSSSSQRVVDSATNWTAGFASAALGYIRPVLNLVLDEAGNDTLDDSMCPSSGSSNTQQATWLSVSSPPTAARMARMAPGLNLTNAEVNALESLCGFESVALEKKSLWCDIFEDEDFKAFEYFGDINKYYGTGPGAYLGAVQGVGYINELIARLTRTSVKDATQTNQTLDSDPATFPLNRTIYADFSHDNQMIAIYAALGLFSVPALSTTVPDPKSGYVTSALVPFSGRLVTERLTCAGAKTSGAQLVRMFVNDVKMPLSFCGSGDGLCDLQSFVDSQEYARSNGAGDWEKCFV